MVYIKFNINNFNNIKLVYLLFNKMINTSISIYILKTLAQEKLLEIEQQHPLYEEMIREVLQSEITELENSVKLINASEIEDWLTSFMT
jgi:hypothetical protein